MKKNEFQCAICNNIYEKSWSDEDSLKEMKDIWGDIPEEEQAVICDDCFKEKSTEEMKEMGDSYKNFKDIL